MLSLLLFACDPPDPCVDPRVDVDVHVIDVFGDEVPDALVELADQACDDLGAGDYRCTADAAGRHSLFVYDPRWEAYAENLDLPEPQCPAPTVEVDVLLVQGMGL